jgi:hypothetical protein
MDLDDGTGTQARFEEYTTSLAAVLGHADRVRPFAGYCVGLLSAVGRKSVEPLAAYPPQRRPKGVTHAHGSPTLNARLMGQEPTREARWDHWDPRPVVTLGLPAET